MQFHLLMFHLDANQDQPIVVGTNDIDMCPAYDFVSYVVLPRLNVDDPSWSGCCAYPPLPGQYVSGTMWQTV